MEQTTGTSWDVYICLVNEALAFEQAGISLENLTLVGGAFSRELIDAPRPGTRVDEHVAS